MVTVLVSTTAGATFAAPPGNTFTIAEIHPYVIEALECSPDRYTLASLRYDLSKLRAKDLVAKLAHSRRYQLLPQGYSICLVFLKLFERVYAPLTAGLLRRPSMRPRHPGPSDYGTAVILLRFRTLSGTLEKIVQ